MPNSRVSRARALIGTRFRMHGRDALHGLDCVGLAALVFDCPAPSGYPLRGGSRSALESTLRGLGFRRRNAGLRAGDLLLLRPGPAQFHLGVWTGESLIHADLGLKRVVEAPGTPRWPLLSAWTYRRR